MRRLERSTDETEESVEMVKKRKSIYLHRNTSCVKLKQIKNANWKN